MSNTIMTTIYNHYMTTYSPKKSDARLDSHNKNELKNIYSDILKRNKEAPLYLFERGPKTTSFALSLKETARQLQHTILDTAGKSENDLFKNKVAFSSNDKIVSAKYVGEQKDFPEHAIPYELEVQTLASPQINVGNYLPNDAKNIPPGNYSFDVNFNNIAYEFQFGVSEEDTNIDIQNKLARLFNHANIGLNASVVDGVDHTSSLQIASIQTGESTVSDGVLFTIQNTTGTADADIVDYLGIDYVANQASNAYFTINGEESYASSNQFTIDKTFEITLNSVSPESKEPVYIGVKANVDSLKDNIYNLVGGYNSFLESVEQYKSITSSNKLSYEMQNVARLYRNELDAVGINITDTGALSIDDNLLTQTTQSEDMYDLLSPLKSFSSSLFRKGEEISRDPLNYAQKKIVAYKNPGKNFTSPYVTSNYSGLLFNYYC